MKKTDPHRIYEINNYGNDVNPKFMKAIIQEFVKVLNILGQFKIDELE